jgi:hypothetical protein
MEICSRQIWVPGQWPESLRPLFSFEERELKIRCKRVGFGLLFCIE